MSAAIVEGLDGAIEVIRDELGVPHCFATTEHDAFFSQGWVHAQDRLWQMEYDRRRASGTWAEVAGSRGLPSDLFYRRVDLAAAIARDYDALAPRTRMMLEAYAAGVNAWIATGSLGREFAFAGVAPARWEPWHCMAVYRVRHLMMGSARSKLWRSAVASVLGTRVAQTMAAAWSDPAIACVPPGAACDDEGARLGAGGEDAAAGSNNWVLAGSRTRSGKPLLAGDPHRELEAPNVYVQGHVRCAEWDVLGIGMPGVPGFPHFGHNDRVAWSITHAMADDQDLFEFDTTAGGQTSRTETIHVRDGDPVDVDVVQTVRGPIIGEGIALCWTATIETNTGFDAIPTMLSAGRVDDLFDAMRPWVEPVNSLLAADVDGAIGYMVRGRLPRRRRADAIWFPVDGRDAGLAWDGWVAFHDLPRSIDPSGGFLFSANNRIAASPDAPYIGLDVAAPSRAKRIVATIENMTDATVDDMAALHRDVLSPAASRWAERLRGWEPLAGWDARMDASSTAAAAYSVFRRELMLLVMERSGLAAAAKTPRNRLLPGVVPESVSWRVVAAHAEAGDTSLIGGAGWDEVIAEARTRAEAAWTGGQWGELHFTAQRHALATDEFDPPRVPLSGDLDTVFAASYVPSQGFVAKHASVARYAWDLADWDNSRWVVPLGAAGEPGAAHATDQQHAWARGQMFAAPYSRPAIEQGATSRERIGPPTGTVS